MPTRVRPTTMGRHHGLGAVVAGVALLASVYGCGQGPPVDRDTSEPSGTSTGATAAAATTLSDALPSTPMAASPSPPGGPRIEPGPHGTFRARYPWTATGKVTRDPDDGCLLLVTDDATYALVGEPDVLPEPGRRVTVQGMVDRTLSTLCTELPLQVDVVTPQ